MRTFTVKDLPPFTINASEPVWQPEVIESIESQLAEQFKQPLPEPPAGYRRAWHFDSMGGDGEHTTFKVWLGIALESAFRPVPERACWHGNDLDGDCSRCGVVGGVMPNLDPKRGTFVPAEPMA